MPPTNARSISIEQLKEQITEQLAHQKYSRNTIIDYCWYAGTIQRFMKRYGFEFYSEEVGDLWIKECKNRSINVKTLNRYRQVVEKFNDILNANELVIRRCKAKYDVPAEFSEVFHAYIQSRQAMKQAEGTIRHKRRNASRFLNFIAKLGCHSVKDINSEIVAKASIANNTDVYKTITRDLLSYLLEEGWISADYTPLIPQIHRGKPTPSVYTKEERQVIESMPDVTTSMGKRDKAMILLAIRNGFRAGNIASLKITDIDYDNEVIHVEKQVKTYVPINSVLFPDVRAAIRDYIENGRPTTDSPFIFIKTTPPYNEVNSDIVYNVVSKYIRNSGIEPNGRKIGPQAMRSSLTSAGVNTGMSYEEMRIVLGHRCEETIKHYAELDDTELRKCAMTVRKPSGLFSRYLDGSEVCPSL